MDGVRFHVVLVHPLRSCVQYHQEPLDALQKGVPGQWQLPDAPLGEFRAK